MERQALDWMVLLEGMPLLMAGLGYTILLAIVVAILGGGMGVFLGTLRYLKGRGGRLFRLLGNASAVYIEGIRSIPLILFLVFIHYGVLPLILHRTDFLVSSLVAFTLFEAAYVGEIIRGGLRSVNQTEWDAAASIGLSFPQQLRLVGLPLALGRTMPALISQGTTLIKDTSLASIIGVVEFTRAGEILYEQSFHDFEILLFQALVYFLLCFSLARWGQRFEANQLFKSAV